ncbi:MAG: S46 family peptidase [Acidobacteriia bacterium]|nr:S46 family peptidase [Terriglobia bacterium]
MWTFDNPPLKPLKEQYGFEPTKQWLEHLRLASVRFNDGGSGSFVSPNGLVLTNHHVASGQLQKVSTPEKDYLEKGFLSRSPSEEMKCPDLELNVLMSMEDVTAKVAAAIPPGVGEKEANDARKAVTARIEKESLDATGLRSDVVSLYEGGEYWLYRYKKYTDIRLVFAPERRIAFFGGDPDNFTYPRYDLDMALFRVYENGKPIASPAYLKWNAKGAATGELVFVSGHPGSTDRMRTLAQLEFARDHGYPTYLELIRRQLDVARRYSGRGPEQAREAADMISGLENALKAIRGEYEAIKEPRLLAGKARDEQDFRRVVASRPDWQKAYGGAWEDVAAAESRYVERYGQRVYRGLGGYQLPDTAMTLVRYVTEIKKPDGERLEEYHEAGLESLRFYLLSPAPVYPGFEEVLLADGLQRALDKLGPDDAFVNAALGGRKPEEVAKDAIAGTKLGDPAERKKLLDGGEAAVAASTDPLIVLARRVDPVLRETRNWYEDTIESVERSGGEKLGRARFAVYGKSSYPDATFTLRLAYGTVKGYPMNGTDAPPKTTFYGLYDRAAGFDFKPPYDLPSRFLERRDRLDLSTPLNFVLSGDIIGGNSGSPVVNRAGEIVGLIFDGNIESLVGPFVFDETVNRAVAVHTAAMTEALGKIYDAEGLVKELIEP